MIEPLWLEIVEVCAIQNEIMAESGGDSGLLNEGALDSTLNKPKNLYHYNNEAILYDLAAAYGYGLVKNHCFLDGNKRIALIATYTFLSINGIELTASEIEAANFFLELAASFNAQTEDMNKIALWLQANSERINL
jgi:death on curing protein